MTTTTTARIALASADFREGETLANEQIFNGMGYSGDNRSPELQWTAIPAGTKSLALTMHDPDAPTSVGFTHWLLYDIDPSVTRLESGAGTPGAEPRGASFGLNDMGANAYAGPCPPAADQPHRYRFTLYALDTPKLDVPPEGKLTYPMLRFIIRDHVLARGMLMGRFGH